MAITFGGSGEQNTSNDASPITDTRDIGTPTNGLLVYFMGTIDTVTHTHGTPTWAGINMSLAVSAIAETTTGIFQRLSIFYLVAPTNGSNTFSLPYADGGSNSANVAYAVSAWFNGAKQDQATVLDQFASGTGSTDPSLVITPTETNTLVVAMYASEADAVLTPTSETTIQDIDNGTRVMGTSYVIKATSNPQTMDWAGADNNWVAVAASFKEFVAAGGDDFMAQILHIGGQFGSQQMPRGGAGMLVI